MNVTPLPSFDICKDHRIFAGQATGQHLFAGLPAAIYCKRAGNHLRITSLDSTYHPAKLTFAVVDTFMLNTQGLKYRRRA